MAIAISISTLFVYIYQSNLMKTQQKMSVWPHLTFGPSWGDDDLSLNLINKGIGPALIHEVHLALDGERLGGIQQIMDALPDSLFRTFSYSSLWGGQVIMASEQITFLRVTEAGATQYLRNALESGRLRMEICYCSVYGDCWRSSGIIVEEAHCARP